MKYLKGNMGDSFTPTPGTSEMVNIFRKTVSLFPVAARSKAYVYGLSPAEIVGSNPIGGMDVCLL